MAREMVHLLREVGPHQLLHRRPLEVAPPGGSLVQQRVDHQLP
jgi:hypothetical protein